MSTNRIALLIAALMFSASVGAIVARPDKKIAMKTSDAYFGAQRWREPISSF